MQSEHDTWQKRYQALHDSIQLVQYDHTEDTYINARHPDEKQAMEGHLRRRVTLALADHILQEPGVLRLKITGTPDHAPDRMVYRYSIPVVRDAGLRDTFTQQMEQEKAKARVEGAERVKVAIDGAFGAYPTVATMLYTANQEIRSLKDEACGRPS